MVVYTNEYAIGTRKSPVTSGRHCDITHLCLANHEGNTIAPSAESHVHNLQPLLEPVS